MKLLVLAGNVNEVTHFAHEFNINPTKLTYVRDDRVLKGMRNPLYIVLKGFWKRYDAGEIWTALQAHMDDGPEYPWIDFPAQSVIINGRMPQTADTVNPPSHPEPMPMLDKPVRKKPAKPTPVVVAPTIPKSPPNRPFFEPIPPRTE